MPIALSVLQRLPRHHTGPTTSYIALTMTGEFLDTTSSNQCEWAIQHRQRSISNRGSGNRRSRPERIVRLSVCWSARTVIYIHGSFLKIQSVGTDGTQVINYSDRFTISGMTGTFPPGVQAGIKKVSGTNGPPSTNQEAPAAAGGAQGAQGDYAVTYTAQTGLIKYAPMQIPPGTKITAKAASPRYPTSSVSIAKTFLPTPKQTTTMTASLTYSPASSHPFQVIGKHVLTKWFC